MEYLMLVSSNYVWMSWLRLFFFLSYLGKFLHLIGDTDCSQIVIVLDKSKIV